MNQRLLVLGGGLTTSLQLKNHQSMHLVLLEVTKTQIVIPVSLVLLIISVRYQTSSISSITTPPSQEQLSPVTLKSTLKQEMDFVWPMKLEQMEKIYVFQVLTLMEILALPVLQVTTVPTLLSYQSLVPQVAIRTRLDRLTAKYVAQEESVSSALLPTINVQLDIIVLRAGFLRRYVQLATHLLLALLNAHLVLIPNTVPMLAT